MKQLTTKSRTSIIKKMSSVFIFYLAVASIVPQFRALQIYQLSMFAAMFFLILSIILMRPAFIFRPDIYTFFSLLFIIYTFGISYLMGNQSIGNRYLDTGLIFIFYLAYKFNSMSGYEDSSKKIINWSLPFIILTSCLTLQGLMENPYLSRSIKTDGELTMQLRIQGIGGYELIYFLTFVCILLFYILFNAKDNINRKQKLLLFIMLGLFLLTILYSNYFTALLMIFISYSIIFASRVKSVIGKLFVVLLLFITTIFSKSIFFFVSNLIINILKSGATVEKLLILQQDIFGYGADSIVTSRMSTLDYSIEAFLNNPITGIIINPISSSQGFIIGFGQHSYFIDTFALFGVFIGSLNMILVIQPFIKRMKNKRLFGLNFSVFISTLILFFMNNVTVSVGYAIFFMYPVIYDWLLQNKCVNLKRKIID